MMGVEGNEMGAIIFLNMWQVMAMFVFAHYDWIGQCSHSRGRLCHTSNQLPQMSLFTENFPSPHLASSDHLILA